MKPLKLLGAIDDEGKPKKPVYVIGPVTQRGDNVIYVNNHAGYVGCRVVYKILRYLQDFKEGFPALYHIWVGQLCPLVTAEVDCELLFGQAGFLY